MSKEYRRCSHGLWDDTDPEPRHFSCSEMLRFPNCVGCPNLEVGKIVWERRYSGVADSSFSDQNQTKDTLKGGGK